jgi:hypothetical protein
MVSLFSLSSSQVLDCVSKSMANLLVLSLIFISVPASETALAVDEITLTIKDHQFSKSEVHVPAGERFRIQIENQDPTPAEFESSDLRVEKIVGGGKITVMVGPLKPGTYKFFDDYHPDTVKGTLSRTNARSR